MPPEITNSSTDDENLFSPLNKVTPLSKYLAMILFIVIPMITLYVGLQFAPTEYIEVEKFVYSETLPIKESADVAAEPQIPSVLPTNINLTAVEKNNAAGFPESDVYIGGVKVLTAEGTCGFESYELDDLFSYRPMLKELISDVSLIVESGTCWFAGGGAEFYSVREGGTTRLIGLEVFECETLPQAECSGFGDLQVLYEIDIDGIVTKQYLGGVFGG